MWGLPRQSANHSDGYALPVAGFYFPDDRGISRKNTPAWRPVPLWLPEQPSTPNLHSIKERTEFQALLPRGTMHHALNQTILSPHRLVPGILHDPSFRRRANAEPAAILRANRTRMGAARIGNAHAGCAAARLPSSQQEFCPAHRNV